MSKSIVFDLGGTLMEGVMFSIHINIINFIKQRNRIIPSAKSFRSIFSKFDLVYTKTLYKELSNFMQENLYFKENKARKPVLRFLA